MNFVQQIQINRIHTIFLSLNLEKEKSKSIMSFSIHVHGEIEVPGRNPPFEFDL